MDIQNLYTVEEHEAGAEMQVHGKDGKPAKCFLTIVGLDSKTWNKALKKNKRKLASDDSQDASAELYAECVIAWRGFTDNGEKLEFSKAGIKGLLLSAPYIVKQIDDFIVNRVNFIKS
jgi:hypothetical protein